jgi:hypothetical protein
VAHALLLRSSLLASGLVRCLSLAPILSYIRMPRLILCCLVEVAVAHEDRGRWTLLMLAPWSPAHSALRHRLARAWLLIAALGSWLRHQVRVASPSRMYRRDRPPKAWVRLVRAGSQPPVGCCCERRSMRKLNPSVQILGFAFMRRLPWIWCRFHTRAEADSSPFMKSFGRW